jgi:ATP-dependent Clp protease ATP-binding subunit ClpA
MTRYKEWSSAVELFGDKSRPGLIGTFVADHPAAVILVSGLEQAHENVLAALPAILDGEQQAGSHGKTIDFRRAIWLFSSTEGKALWGQTGTGNTAFALDLGAVLNSAKTDRWGERKPDQVPGELVARLAQGARILFRPPHGHHHFDLLIRTCTATWR